MRAHEDYHNTLRGSAVQATDERTRLTPNRRALRRLLATAALYCGVHAAIAATIEIKVANVAGKGKVSVAVCDREHFLKQCVHNASVPAQAGTTTVTVADVPPGTWAVLAYEDANDNGKLDRTLGIPTENWGMSRDARANFGPPKFDDAALDVKDGKTVVEIRLR